MGATKWPPNPQAFGAPRHSRGAPLVRGACSGAPKWPPNPQAFGAPRRSRGAPLVRVACSGAPKWPPNPLLAGGELHVLELDRLAVDAARGRRDPAGELARLHHRRHEARHVGLVLRRRQPLVLAGVPFGLTDDAAVG